MAAAIDLSMSPGDPNGGGSIDPLIAALDRYSVMLEKIAESLKNAIPSASIKPVVATSAAQPKKDPRYNPDLDVALGLEPPKLEAPEIKPIASPKVPEIIAPSLKIPEVPGIEPVKLKAPKVPEIAPVKLEPPKVPEIAPTKIEPPKVPGIEPVRLDAPKVPELTAPAIKAPKVPGIEPIKLEPPKVPELTAPSISAPKMPGIEPVKLEPPKVPGIAPVRLEPPKVPGIAPVRLEPPKVPGIAPVRLEPPKVSELTAPSISAPKMPGIEPVKLEAPKVPGIEPVKLEAPKVPGIEPVKLEAPKVPGIEPVKLEAPKVPGIEPVKLEAPKVPGIEPVKLEAPKVPEIEKTSLVEKKKKTNGIPEINVKPLNDTIDKMAATFKLFLDSMDRFNRGVSKPDQENKPLESQTESQVSKVENKKTEEEDSSKKMVAGFVKTTILTRIMAEAFNRLATLMKPLNEAVHELGNAFQPIIDALASLFRLIVGPVMLGYKALSVLVTAILRPFQMILNYFNNMIDVVSDLLDILSVYGNAQKLAANTASDAFKTVRKTVTSLLTDPLSAIPNLIGQIAEAVETFNPGAMLEFELALRDAKAVFGEALLPIIRIATDVVRKFADTIRPILQKLQPQLEKLARSLGDQLIRNIDMLASSIEKMLPIIERYAFYVNQSLEAEKARKAKALQAADPLTAKAKETAAANIPRAAGFDWTRLQNRTIEAQMGDEMRALEKDLAIAKKQGKDAEADVAQKKLDALNNLYETITKQGTRFEFLQKVDPDKAAKDEKYQAALKEFTEAQAGVASTLEAQKKSKDSPETKAKNLDAANKAMVAAQKKLGSEMERMIKASGVSETQGLAAPMHPQFKSAADLTRETMLQAFLATSSRGNEKEKEDENARKNVADLPNVIQGAVFAALNQAKEVMKALPNDKAFARGPA